MENKWKIVPMELGYENMPWEWFIFDETASPEKNRERFDFPVLAFLLIHEETGEKRLVDCGPDSRFPELDAANVRCPGWGMTDIADALGRLGIDPGEVTKVYATHLHGDHVGGLEFLHDVEVIVQKREVEYGCERKYRCPYDEAYARMYPNAPGPAFMRHLHKMTFVDGDVDFGDGIQVFTAPGHTAGSQGVLVDTRQGPCFFPGDVMYIQACWDRGRPSGHSYDIRTSFYTLQKIQRIVHEHNALFVPSHSCHSLDLFESCFEANERPRTGIESDMSNPYKTTGMGENVPLDTCFRFFA